MDLSRDKSANDMSHMQLRSPTLTSKSYLNKKVTSPNILDQTAKSDKLNFDLRNRSQEPKYNISTNDKSLDTTGRITRLNEIDQNATKLLINVKILHNLR